MKHLKNYHKHLKERSVVSKQLANIATLILLLVILGSCSTVRVASDYDRQANFNDYKTFAFFKTGIDKAEINDLDKRRILRAIEAQLLEKGFTKSENPDLLVSIFTKSQQRVDVYNNTWGFGGWGGWGWGYGWNNYPTVSTSTEGVLFIDLIDAKKRELVWQGQGTGYLSQHKKEERIQEFVSKIMEKYPPNIQK